MARFDGPHHSPRKVARQSRPLFLLHQCAFCCGARSMDFLCTFQALFKAPRGPLGVEALKIYFTRRTAGGVCRSWEFRAPGPHGRALSVAIPYHSVFSALGKIFYAPLEAMFMPEMTGKSLPVA